MFVLGDAVGEPSVCVCVMPDDRKFARSRSASHLISSLMSFNSCSIYKRRMALITNSLSEGDLRRGNIYKMEVVINRLVKRWMGQLKRRHFVAGDSQWESCLQ